MREKIIELLMQKGFGVEGATIAADHLIANDVTIPVHCKDCVFCYYNSSNGTFKCRSMNGMYRTVNPDDFCSYGERRTDG